MERIYAQNEVLAPVEPSCPTDSGKTTTFIPAGNAQKLATITNTSFGIGKNLHKA